MRDSLRKKVYSAQSGILRDRISEDEVREYFEHVTDDLEWEPVIEQAVKPFAEVTIPHLNKPASLVIPGQHKGCHAHLHNSRICLEDWGFTQGTVLHELSHLLIPTWTPGHGVEFMQVFAMLMEHETEGAGELFLERLRDKYNTRTEHPKTRANEIRRGVLIAKERDGWNYASGGFSVRITLKDGRHISKVFLYDEKADALVPQVRYGSSAERESYPLSDIAYIARN